MPQELPRERSEELVDAYEDINARQGHVNADMEDKDKQEDVTKHRDNLNNIDSFEIS